MINILNTDSDTIGAQFVFRKHRSSEPALLSQKETILEGCVRNWLTQVIFLGYSKGPDCSDHDRLLDKFFFYRIRGTPVFLINILPGHRREHVLRSKRASESKPLTSGVL